MQPPVAKFSETDRVDAFSDGVFAIVITLLGFELTVPEVEPVTGRMLVSTLAAQWPTYLVFVVSFVSLLIMWMNHHRLFQLIRSTSGGLMAANGVLLMFATTVPFATSILAGHLGTSAGQVAAAIYSGIFLLINLSYIGLWRIAASRLLYDSVPEAQIKRIDRSYLMGAPGYVLAGALAFVSPYVSLLVIVAFWLLWAMLPYADGGVRMGHQQPPQDAR